MLRSTVCGDCGAQPGHPCYPACSSRWAPEIPTFAGVPGLPPGHAAATAWEWMDRLPAGWSPVPAWGRDGWDLGDWPYVVVVHYNPPTTDCAQVYAVATYIEGDLEAHAFTTRTERDAETDDIAICQWRHNSTGPADLSAYDDNIAPEHRGPAHLDRLLDPTDGASDA
ncbi:hypothetical protein GCM10009795_096560 [Nocardioides hankookensis]